jgi:hypothetical protein
MKGHQGCNRDTNNFTAHIVCDSQKLTLCTTAVPTALPAKGRTVIRRPSLVGAGDETSSDRRDSRRNSSGSKGDSNRMGVRDLGFDRGRRDKDSMETWIGVLSLDECSASERRNVRVGLCSELDLDRRRESTEKTMFTWASGAPFATPSTLRGLSSLILYDTVVFNCLASHVCVICHLVHPVN